MATLHDIRLSELKDFGELKAWQGTHKELVDTSFIILSIAPIETQYGLAYVADIIPLNDETNSETESTKYLLGSVAIVHQLELFQEELPFAARVDIEPASGKRAAYYKLASVDPVILESFLVHATQK